MKNQINLSEVMSKAWEIYRANSTPDCKAVFGICLEMAWSIVKAETSDPIAEWSEMTEAQQIKMLKSCVKKAAKDTIGYSVEDNYNGFNETVLWQLHNVNEFINEAYCKLAPHLNAEYLDKLNAKRNAAYKPNVKLIALCYRAAKESITRIYRDDIKHGKASVKTITDKNGEERSYIDTMASSRADNTEATALLNIAIAEILSGRDETDKIILVGKRDGYTEREIAKEVNITNVAVHKRIQKLRADLKANVS